ncbi:MAG: hypothetical protein WCO96_06035 [Actinomycetes bacterium]
MSIGAINGEPRPCDPCKGTGALNSNAGGEPHRVVCPWCEGGGVALPEHDAQEAGERLREQPPPDKGGD